MRQGQGLGFMLRLSSIDKIGRAPRALALPHIGVRGRGPEIELSFFETTPSRRESGGNIQNLMLYATPKLSPFLSKQNPQYCGRNRLLAGPVFLATGKNIWDDEAEIGCAQLSTCIVEPQVQYSHFPHFGANDVFFKGTSLYFCNTPLTPSQNKVEAN